MASYDLRSAAHERGARWRDNKQRRRNRGLEPRLRLRGHEKRDGNDALGGVRLVYRRTAGVRMVAGRMAAHVGVHTGGVMMIVVVIADVGVHERRRQRASLERNRESDNEKAPAH